MGARRALAAARRAAAGDHGDLVQDVLQAPLVRDKVLREPAVEQEAPQVVHRKVRAARGGLPPLERLEECREGYRRLLLLQDRAARAPRPRGALARVRGDVVDGVEVDPLLPPLLAVLPSHLRLRLRCSRARSEAGVHVHRVLGDDLVEQPRVDRVGVRPAAGGVAVVHVAVELEQLAAVLLEVFARVFEGHFEDLLEDVAPAAGVRGDRASEVYPGHDALLVGRQSLVAIQSSEDGAGDAGLAAGRPRIHRARLRHRSIRSGPPLGQRHVPAIWELEHAVGEAERLAQRRALGEHLGREREAGEPRVVHRARQPPGQIRVLPAPALDVVHRVVDGVQDGQGRRHERVEGDEDARGVGDRALEQRGLVEVGRDGGPAEDDELDEQARVAPHRHRGRDDEDEHEHAHG
mmetsp:Transcript_3609/g.6911  ORF Transcript_3609/g.6911 Transcript_3609/m.6911 type:complete len:407 (+) Transcript_3609:405-1625(+)